MNRTGWLCVALGVASSAIVLLPLAGDAGARDAGSAVTLPDRLAGYSYLTGDASEAPPGRAVALYQHGFGVEFMDFPQAVVLAADTDLYRRLDAAEDLSGPESQGDPGPMLLSPDGRQVALGDHDTSEASLGLVDLGTGEVDRRPLPDARSVLPVAWSADGSQVAFLSGEQPTNPYSGAPLMGELRVFSLDSGKAEPVPGGSDAVTAAFSPDGREVAVQRLGQDPGIVIVDLASSTSRELPTDGLLTGSHAWSPDGRLLAVELASSFGFVDVSRAGASTAFEVAVDDPRTHSVEGWTGEREVLLLDSSDADVTTLVSHPLAGGDSREVTRIEDTGSYGVTRFQLASGRLSDLEVRPAADPDRGPLPPPLHVALAILVGLAVTLVAARVVRRRRAARS